jgi:hypothetical protein
MSRQIRCGLADHGRKIDTICRFEWKSQSVGTTFVVEVVFGGVFVGEGDFVESVQVVRVHEGRDAKDEETVFIEPIRFCPPVHIAHKKVARPIALQQSIGRTVCAQIRLKKRRTAHVAQPDF